MCRSTSLWAYPRMRGGNRLTLQTLRLSIGPIPACAGETNITGKDACGEGAYPRMRGGNL